MADIFNRIDFSSGSVDKEGLADWSMVTPVCLIIEEGERMKSSIEKIILRKKEYFIKYLEEIVSIDSSVIQMGKQGKEQGAQRIVEKKLKDLGACVDVFCPDNSEMENHPEFNHGHSYQDRPNVVGIIKGTGGGRSLLINAHIDVVPPGDEKNWATHPFKPVIRNGKLFGRGSCDMKAGGAAALMALEILKECGVKLKGDVIYESVVDEEGGGNGTLACCMKGYKADAAIIPEPTELNLMPAHMGWMFYRITFTGKPVHCAFKWNGINAIEKCLSFMAMMREVERQWMIEKRHPYLPPPTICFTVIQGGTSSSTVPEQCSLDMSVHFHPCETIEGKIGARIEEELMHNISNFIQGDDWLKENPPRVEKFQQGSAYDIGSDHPFVKCVAESLFDITGRPPLVKGLASGADARLINNYAETPALLCGPGSISDAHSANEFVEIQQYMDAISMFCDVIIKWCGVADESN